MTTYSSRSVFPALTGVRALAAYLVFFHHFGSQMGLPPWLYRLTLEFHTGVTIFFVLSGFLIYLKYSETASLKRGFLIEYYRNRIARIYPVYFVITVVTALYLYSVGQRVNVLRDVLLQITFVRGFFNDLKFVGVPQGWTLTVEECFYFSFPFLILATRRTRSLVWPLLIVYSLGLTLWGLGTRLHFYSFFVPPYFVILYTFFGRAAEFFAGMFLARYLVNRPLKAPVGLRVPWRTMTGLIGFVAGVLLMSRLQASTNVGGPYGLFAPAGMVLNNWFLAVVTAIFFWGLIVERSVVQVFFGNGIMVLLGKASYAFYLIHMGVVQIMVYQHLTHNIWLNFLALVVISILIFWLIEEPCRKTIRAVKVPTPSRAVFARDDSEKPIARRALNES